MRSSSPATGERITVLLIDDWGLALAVTDQERRDLLEILEGRYGERSTIITSQLPPAQWHDYLADATLADAICDRILHNAHRMVTLAKEEGQARPLTTASVASL